MEAAKAAVSKLTSHRGHHTTVEESVQPAVTRETVQPHRHEEATQAVDREVHQHHHHTTVQPLSHTERLPEKHTHNILPTEHREFHHDNDADTKQRIETELGRFQDSTRTEKTHHTQTAAPVVTGEHVHHHVHETVIPVIHKQTIQPEVVHTTIPIHETHHAAAQHHGISALPMKTLDEFKNAGGSITGGKHAAHEEYEGQPRPYNEKLSTTFEKLGLGGAGAGGGETHATAGVGSTTPSHHTHKTGSHVGGNVSNDSARYNPGNGGLKSDADTVPQRGSGSTMNAAEGTRHTGTSANTTEETALGASDTRTKPSLMDRLNPRRDADGDGKPGMLD